MCIMYRTCRLLWTAAKTVNCIIHLWCGAHTWNATSHSVVSCWERCETASLLRHIHIEHDMAFYTARSDIVPHGVLWRNLTESPGELQLEPWMPGISTLKDIFLSWRVCLRSASLQPIKRLRVRRPRQPHTPVSLFFSWFHDCHKYRVDVFIRAPFIHKKGSIKATNY